IAVQLGGGRSELPLFVLLFLVGIGLLLATTTAVTALADERTRGSLDILLATPVKTRAVVWAKWRAGFGRVLATLILPSILMPITWALQKSAGRGGSSFLSELGFVMFVLMAIYVMAAGACFVSLGLYLATRMAKFGRAVGVAIAIYAIM